MYEFALVVHSWLRWVVVIAALLSIFHAARGLARRSEFSAIQRISGVVLLASVHTMLLLGVGLLFVWSPIATSALADMGAAMKDKLLRFWSVEHTTLMILATVAITVGHVSSKKATEAIQKHRRALVGFGLGIVLIALGMPWPFREAIGRALFRF